MLLDIQLFKWANILNIFNKVYGPYFIKFIYTNWILTIRSPRFTQPQDGLRFRRKYRFFIPFLSRNGPRKYISNIKINLYYCTYFCRTFSNNVNQLLLRTTRLMANILENPRVPLTTRYGATAILCELGSEVSPTYTNT